MGIEIERKFMVTGDAWRDAPQRRAMRQAYLAIQPQNTVRVRIAEADAWLTIKGPNQAGIKPEFEYAIPLADAEILVQLSPYPVIEKVRHYYPYEGLVWEVDEFAGANAGLIVAEVELDRVDQDVPLPDWIGTEVTGDPRYLNAQLCQHPYRDWPPSSAHRQ